MAEPPDAVDRAGILVLRALTSSPPARQLILSVVGEHRRQLGTLLTRVAEPARLAGPEVFLGWVL